MSKKDDLKIDIMSSIDDEIIEKHTKKRFDLLSGKGFGRKRKTIAAIIAFAACLAVLASFIVVILPLIPTGQIPVYQGMTVSNEAPVINTESADARPFTNNKTISLLGKHSGNDDQKTRRPVVDIVKDSLTVDAESEYLYYSKPNEDIYITVHVNNPGEFEILSFTLNGVKYSSYMFEEGSDLENLVLKINVGDADGVVEYTIDAIKYVEGTKIKDVLMEGDKTVSVAITPDAPTSEITDVNIGISDIGFNASLNDEKNLVNTSGEDYFAVICNNDTIVEKKIISSKDKTSISFTGLDPDTTYRYAIIGVYDAIDGEGKCIHVLHEEEFTTQALVSIGDSYLDGADVCFDITWHESHTGNQTLDALALYDGENKLFDLEVTDARISDLPFDKEFTLVATYTYNGTQYETYKTVYSPKTSEGLEISYGSVVGVGSCNDTVLYINAPVAENAFKGNGHITAVYLGEGVESIGENAFQGCTALKSIFVPSSVTSFGAFAFEGCESLESVYITDLVSWCARDFEGSWDNPLKNGADLYINGELLTDLVIPDGVTSIGAYAFFGCTSIVSVTLPEIIVVGADAFGNCPNIDWSLGNMSSVGWMLHIQKENGSAGKIESSLTSDGLCASFDSYGSTPWLRLVYGIALDLKEGVYMEIRIDEFNYSKNIDSWFDVMLSDQQYMIPGLTEYGEGAQCLIRPHTMTNDNASYNISWHKGGFERAGLPSNDFPVDIREDGKHYLTVELSWDEAKNTFVYTINGASASAEIIKYMNEKWGGEDSLAHVGFCFQHSQAGEDIACTVLKFGTSAEDAIVPSGD